MQNLVRDPVFRRGKKQKYNFVGEGISCFINETCAKFC